jgi:hypothetical protein
MKRIYLLAALLMSPAWSQEPAAEALEPVEAEPDEVVYVPPEKPAAPAPEQPQRPPRPAPESDDFLSQLFEIAFEELLGTGGYEYDDATFSNYVLSCRVQKEIHSSPPSADNCPIVD